MEEKKIIIYQSEDGQTKIDVRLENETVWLTTHQMALLFEKEESNIRRHVINVFKEGELERENNVQKIHVATSVLPPRFYSGSSTTTAYTAFLSNPFAFGNY